MWSVKRSRELFQTKTSVKNKSFSDIVQGNPLEKRTEHKNELKEKTLRKRNAETKSKLSETVLNELQKHYETVNCKGNCIGYQKQTLCMCDSSITLTETLPTPVTFRSKFWLSSKNKRD